MPRKIDNLFESISIEPLDPSSKPVRSESAPACFSPEEHQLLMAKIKLIWTPGYDFLRFGLNIKVITEHILRFIETYNPDSHDPSRLAEIGELLEKAGSFHSSSTRDSQNFLKAAFINHFTCTLSAEHFSLPGDKRDKINCLYKYWKDTDFYLADKIGIHV